MIIQAPNYSEVFNNYSKFKQSSLHGRYLEEKDLLDVFKKLSHKFKIKNEGQSEEGRIISSFHLGSGSRKILIWSQMHGNESTTTKAVLDLLNYFIEYPEFSRNLLKHCCLIIIPVLNPDGAVKYTRVNSNGIDLNRDAYLKTQSESKILQRIYTEFKPDVCFNMHDQRTIFSAGDSKKPATVSFLSPAFNKEREVNETRKIAMSLISSANALLQKFIPGQVGRYDDGFNINCIGDYFQSEGTPTILYEAGHFADDYEREETRKYIFVSLLNMILDVVNEVELISEAKYFEIPENQKLFYDVILRNVWIDEKQSDIAIQYKETLNGHKIEFIPIIEQIGELDSYFGHREIDLFSNKNELNDLSVLRVGEVLSSIKVNNNVFVI